MTGEIFNSIQPKRQNSRENTYRTIKPSGPQTLRAAGKPSWPQRGGGNPVDRLGAGVDNTLTYADQRASTGLRNTEDELIDKYDGTRIKWLRSNGNKSQFNKYVDGHVASKTSLKPWSAEKMKRMRSQTNMQTERDKAWQTRELSREQSQGRTLYGVVDGSPAKKVQGMDEEARLSKIKFY